MNVKEQCQRAFVEAGLFCDVTDATITREVTSAGLVWVLEIDYVSPECLCLCARTWCRERDVEWLIESAMTTERNREEKCDVWTVL